MSWPAIRWSYRYRLPLFEGAVLRCIAYHANLQTNVARPSRETIAKESGCSIRRVVQAIVWLEGHGFIEVKRSRGRGRTNRYILRIKGAPRAPLIDEKRGTACTITEGENVHVSAKKGAPRAPGPYRDRSRSGANAPGNRSIWDRGERLVGSRAYLGKLIRKHGEEIVQQAIETTEKKQPADAKSYITAILKNQGRESIYVDG